MYMHAELQNIMNTHECSCQLFGNLKFHNFSTDKLNFFEVLVFFKGQAIF